MHSQLRKEYANLAGITHPGKFPCPQGTRGQFRQLEIIVAVTVREPVGDGGKRKRSENLVGNGGGSQHGVV